MKPCGSFIWRKASRTPSNLVRKLGLGRAAGEGAEALFWGLRTHIDNVSAALKNVVARIPPGSPDPSSMRRCRVLELMEPGLGGVPKHVFDLLSRISTERFDIWLGYSAIRADAALAERLADVRQRGMKTLHIPMSRGISLSKDLHALIELVRLLNRERFDVVHCHSSKAGFLGRIAARLGSPGTVTIFTPHGIAYRIHWWYWLLEKFASLFTDYLVAVSESEKQDIVRHYIIHPSRIKVICNGLPLAMAAAPLGGERMVECRKALGVRPSDIVIGSGGLLCARKDPLTFFRAAKAILERYPNAFFIWVGGGEMRPFVEKWIAHQGLSGQTMVTGWLPTEAVQNFFEILDIAVSSSRTEALPYMICEAMAKSKPVVATRIVGHVDLVLDGVNGLLVPVKCPALLAEAISGLVASPLQRAQMGAEGQRRFLQHFTLDRMANEIQALYLYATEGRLMSGKAAPT